MTNLAGIGTMIRFILRQDRIVIPLYVVLFLTLVVSQAVSSQELYTTQAERDEYAATAGSNPALIALTGPAYAIDTVGGDVAWQVGGFGGAVVGLVSMLLIGRHTRAEEQSGRSELLRANVLGRYAHPAAALIVVAGINVLLAATTALALIGMDLPVVGSIAFGASMGAVGLVFAGVAAVAAQVSESASAVYGLGGAVLGLAYLLRAAGDVGNGALSWLSPIGWGQGTKPFADEREWPLALALGVTVVLVAIAGALMARRDHGAGLMPTRPGPATASAALTHPIGFALRQQRGLLLGWVVGLFVAGLSIGSMGQEVDSLIGDSTMANDLFGQTGGADLVDSFYASILVMMALIGTAYVVSSALRLRGEESAGRVELLLATAVPRWRLLGSQLVVTLTGAALVVAACGLGAGLAYGIRGDDLGAPPRLLGAALASLPAVWVVAGLAVALVGLAPRASSLAWAALAGCLFLWIMGPLLHLPDWVMDLSPFSHIPQVPATSLTMAPLVVLTGVAAVLAAVGLAGFQRRDIG